jgi:hypothetical protein
MKKLYLLFALSLAGAFVFNSCNKDDFEAKNWPIPQEVLDYYYFSAGSYWVFENDKTGDKDTLVVSSHRKYWIDGSNGDKYEQADVYINSSLDGYTYHYYVMTQGSAGCIRGGAKNPCYSIMCSKFKTGDVFGESISMFYDIRVGFESFGDFSSDKSRLKIKEFYTSLSTSGNLFNKVVKVEITYSLISNRKDIIFYWAKDAGIIKKENITDSQTWNLIDYKLTA